MQGALRQLTQRAYERSRPNQSNNIIVAKLEWCGSMERKPEFFLVALLVAVGLLAMVFKSIYEDLLKAAIFKLLSPYFDVSPDGVIMRLGEMVLPLTVAGLIVVVLYRYQRRVFDNELREITRPRFKLLFDPANPLNVRYIRGIHGNTGEKYWIGIENVGAQTIGDVSVRALDSWFTREAIAVAQGRSSGPSRSIIVHTTSALHPNAPDFVEVVGLSYGSASSSPDYIFNTVQRFVIEVVGQNVPSIRQEFEYDPQRRPMLRKV